MPSKSDRGGASRFNRNTPEPVVIFALGARDDPAENGLIDSNTPSWYWSSTAAISLGESNSLLATESTVGVPSSLLKILDLFLDTINGPLYLDNTAGHLSVETLAADGICLAEHFLTEKVQRPTNQIGFISKQLAKLIQMGAQAGQFLCDICSFGKQSHFSKQVFLPNIGINLREQ
jgi:hypothetical protein